MKKSNIVLLIVLNKILEYVWIQQSISEPAMFLDTTLNIKKYSNILNKIFFLKINDLLRIFLPVFSVETNNLIEIIDRIGYNLSLKEIIQDLVRSVFFKKNFQKFWINSLESDFINKRKNIRIESKHKELGQNRKISLNKIIKNLLIMLI